MDEKEGVKVFQNTLHMTQCKLENKKKDLTVKRARYFTLVWWQFGNFIVCQMKFSTFLHQCEHPERIFDITSKNSIQYHKKQNLFSKDWLNMKMLVIKVALLIWYVNEKTVFREILAENWNCSISMALA